jgi:predicted transcriptional regulator
MGTMTIRLPDDKHERLKQLASSRGISLNKLIEEFSIQAITEADAMTRFKIRAAKGSRERGLSTLDMLDENHVE